MRSAREVGRGSIGTSICVIGSGPVGQTVATHLARAGHDVLVLEAGGESSSRSAQRLVATVTPALGDGYPDLRDLSSVALGGTSGRPMVRLDAAARAGTGIRLRGLDPIDVEPRPAAGLPGWPLTYGELRAATEVAAGIFGICSLASGEDIELLESDGLRTAAFHLTDRRRFSEPCFDDEPRLDVLLDAPVASLEVGPDHRISCAVVHTEDGREIRVHAEAFVVAAAASSTCRLLLSSTGMDSRGVANSSGVVGRGLMDHPIVSAGWLVPQDGSRRDALLPFAPHRVGGDLIWPKLVPDPDLVRRDELSQSWVTLVPRPMPARLARLAAAARRPAGERTGAVAAARTLRDEVQSRRVPPDLGRQMVTVASGIDDVARTMLGKRPVRSAAPLEDTFWADGGGLAAARSFQLLQCVEQLPDEANRLVLTDRLDPTGRRMARMCWRWSEEDSRREQAFGRLVRSALHDSGLGAVVAPVTAGNRHVEKWSAHHLSGGTPMSTDPAGGVVDRRCRSHDHPNLWLAGTCVFPTAGHANPTLTAVATAVIVADDVHAAAGSG